MQKAFVYNFLIYLGDELIGDYQVVEPYVEYMSKVRKKGYKKLIADFCGHFGEYPEEELFKTAAELKLIFQGIDILDIDLKNAHKIFDEKGEDYAKVRADIIDSYRDGKLR